MTAPTMNPIKQDYFVLDLPKEIEKIEFEWKEYNWMGRIIHWVRASDKGLIQKTLLHTAALLVALVLMVSIVGVPLLIYASQELVRQQERASFAKKMNALGEIAKDKNRIMFFIGRKGLFEGIEVKLQPSTRNEIIQDLNHLGITDEKNKVPLKNMGDSDLLKMILENDHSSFANYKLKVNS